MFVIERTEARAPKLDEVRPAVTRDWHEARRQATNEAFYQRSRERYTVVVERPAWLDDPNDLTAVGQR